MTPLVRTPPIPPRAPVSIFRNEHGQDPPSLGIKNTLRSGPPPDLEGWPLSWAPNLGGLPFALDEPAENPIFGVRINPPTTDTHLFLRERRT